MAEGIRTDRRFTPRKPPARDIGAYVAEAVSVARDRYQARILLHAPLETLRSRVPPTYGTLEAIDERTSLLRTGADWLGGLAVYIAVIGSTSRCSSPPSSSKRCGCSRIASRGLRDNVK
jgi:hypothetical protein